MNRYKIMLIDTSEDFRRNISELLQQEGLAVLEACDAYAGLRQIHIYRPHTVICDMVLGNSSALELIRMIKETGQPALTGIPFILLHSGLDQAARTQARALGVEHFVDKLRPWPAIREAVWSALARGAG